MLQLDLSLQDLLVLLVLTMPEVDLKLQSLFHQININMICILHWLMLVFIVREKLVHFLQLMAV
jgi:hypothetical protein